MAYYRTCPFCGDNLDPGERCDCQDERRKREELFEGITKVESRTGQMVFRLRPMSGGIRNEQEVMC